MGAAANTCSLWAPNSPSSGAQELPLLPPGQQPRLQESTEGQPRSTEKASDCRASRGPGQRLGRGGLHAGESQAQQAMRRGQPPQAACPRPQPAGAFGGGTSLCSRREGSRGGPGSCPGGYRSSRRCPGGCQRKQALGCFMVQTGQDRKKLEDGPEEQGGGHAQERHHRAGQAGSPCPAGGGSRRGPSVSFLKMLRALPRQLP